MRTDAGFTVILDSIWGPGHENDTHYLRVLVGHLRQKLNDDPARSTHIRTVQGVGYRFGAPG
jgi:two-component system KDP operon response regulator KdpE